MLFRVLIAVVLLTGCAAKNDHDSPSSQSAGVLGPWHLSGLMLDGEMHEIADKTFYGIDVAAHSVTFVKQCKKGEIRVTSGAEIGATIIALLKDVDTSCEAPETDEKWLKGSHGYEVSGTTLK